MSNQHSKHSSSLFSRLTWFTHLFKLHLYLTHSMNILIFNLTSYVLRLYCFYSIADNEFAIDFFEEMLMTFQICGSFLQIIALARNVPETHFVVPIGIEFICIMYWQSLDTKARGNANYYIEKLIFCDDKFSYIFLVILGQLFAGHIAWLYDKALRSFQDVKKKHDTCEKQIISLLSPKTTVVVISVQFIDRLLNHLEADHTIFRNVLWKSLFHTTIDWINVILTNGFLSPNIATVIHYECLSISKDINHTMKFIIHYWIGTLVGFVLAHYFYHIVIHHS